MARSGRERPGQLGYAHARAVEELEDGSVPALRRPLAGDRGQQRADLLFAQRLGEALWYRRRPEARTSGRRPRTPSTTMNRCSERTATMARATDAGARPAGPEMGYVARHRRLVDTRRSSAGLDPLAAQPGLIAVRSRR